MKILTTSDVIAIHDLVIGEHELQGVAGDKFPDAVLARIENRLSYGMINDAYELAACYACYLAVGHVFSDANKRTAFACMDVCLSINDIFLDYDPQEAGDLIVKAAQGIVDELELSAWLRQKADQ